MGVFDRVKENLEREKFEVSIFETAAEALDYLNKKIDGKSVGVGGSVTLRDMGLFDRLSPRNKVYWHWYIPEGMSAREVQEKAAFADIYLSSINGLAETGEIINIDGIGNRVAAMGFGHEKVYLVAGKNKLAKDYESAMFRARNVAAPLNARRLGYKTPCALGELRCYDCRSEQRICNNFLVFRHKPELMDMEVVLINEDLGL